jgi:hypothetical protein
MIESLSATQSIFGGSAERPAEGASDNALTSRSTRRRSRLIDARIFRASGVSMGEVLCSVRFEGM